MSISFYYSQVHFWRHNLMAVETCYKLTVRELWFNGANRNVQVQDFKFVLVSALHGVGIAQSPSL
jgi:hypothetical protein